MSAAAEQIRPNPADPELLDDIEKFLGEVARVLSHPMHGIHANEMAKRAEDLLMRDWRGW